jgi:hypothetical protein
MCDPSQNLTELDGICLNQTDLAAAQRTYPINRLIRFDNLLINTAGDFQTISVPFTAAMQGQIQSAAIACEKFPQGQKSCNLLANMCAALMYDPASQPCLYLDGILTSPRTGLFDYYNWPIGKPFLSYFDTFRHVLEEGIILREFNYADIITIHLARFSRDGHYEGFRKLEFDLLHCGQKARQKDVWREFGFNYDVECIFDLQEQRTTDFFDPFIEDLQTQASSNPVLRPLPIVVRNYRAETGGFVNQAKDSSRWTTFRRFFLYDNYTSDTVIQYARTISIVFEVNRRNHHAVYVPYFLIEYAQVNRSSIPIGVVDLDRTKETLFHPKFTFSVTYVLEITSFWDAVLYLFIVFIILGLTYWVMHTFTYLKSYGYAGIDHEMVIEILGDLSETIAAIFLLMLFIFGFYCLFLYKWSDSMTFIIPPKAEFGIFFPILCAALAFKLAGAAIKVWLQTNCHFFLVDWQKHRVPPWRRFIVTSEWSKLVGVRSYSISFSLFIMVMLLDGLRYSLIATPIPTSELIDIGTTYPILRFAFAALVWLLLFLVQWLFCNFVYWKLCGDPFRHFMEICRTTNVSVLMLLTKNHGFYVHGKTEKKVVTHSLADNIDPEEEEEEEEEEDSEDRRVSDPVDPLSNTVQEVYLTMDFALSIHDKREEIRLGQVPPAQLYESLNGLLRRFFSQQQIQDRYFISDYSVVQVIDLAPELNENSVFTKVSDRFLRHTMLYGIQGSLMLAYLTLFATIDIATDSPAIAAFVVFVIDVIVQLTFKYRGQYKLTQKGLLDPTFLIT